MYSRSNPYSFPMGIWAAMESLSTTVLSINITFVVAGSMSLNNACWGVRLGVTVVGFARLAAFRFTCPKAPVAVSNKKRRMVAILFVFILPA